MTMKSQLYRLLLVTLFISQILPLKVFGQENTDLEGWSAVELDIKATEKLSFSISEHLRLRNDITTTKNYFTQIKVNYEVFKNFDIGGGVRYITRNDDVGNKQGLESFFRYQFDARFKYKIEKVSVLLRLRYQNKNQLGFSENEGDVHKEQLRFRIGLGYKIKPIKLNLRLFGELFNETKSVNSDGGFNRHRYTFRISRKFKNVGTFTLFFAKQDDTFEDITSDKSILGFKYSYAIDFTK